MFEKFDPLQTQIQQQSTHLQSSQPSPPSSLKEEDTIVESTPLLKFDKHSRSPSPLKSTSSSNVSSQAPAEPSANDKELTDHSDDPASSTDKQDVDSCSFSPLNKLIKSGSSPLLLQESPASLNCLKRSCSASSATSPFTVKVSNILKNIKRQSKRFKKRKLFKPSSKSHLHNLIDNRYQPSLAYQLHHSTGGVSNNLKSIYSRTIFKKKSRSANKKLYLNTKYASLSSSSSSSSSVSSSSSPTLKSSPNILNQPVRVNNTNNSESVIVPTKEQEKENTVATTNPPMKLHEFYHSVPFKCPFCFTFKENPTDFIDHLAVSHFSDVKDLYEKKCSKFVLEAEKAAAAAKATTATSFADEVSSASMVIPPSSSQQSSPNSSVSKSDELKPQTSAKPSDSFDKSSSSLPPRKQPRLLKSPLDEEEGGSQDFQGVDIANNYYNYLKQQNQFTVPTSLLQAATMEQQQQANASNTKQFMMAAAAAAAASLLGNQQQSQQLKSVSNTSSTGSVTGEASMRCAICDRGFEYYSNLRRHIKTKHKIFGKQVKEYVIKQHHSSSFNPQNSLLNMRHHHHNHPSVATNMMHSSFGNENQINKPTAFSSNLVNTNNSKMLNSDQLNGSAPSSSALMGMMMSPHSQQQKPQSSSASSSSSTSSSSSSHHSSSSLNRNQSQASSSVVGGSVKAGGLLTSLSSSSIHSNLEKSLEKKSLSHRSSKNAANDESIEDDEQAEVASMASSESSSTSSARSTNSSASCSPVSSPALQTAGKGVSADLASSNASSAILPNATGSQNANMNATMAAAIAAAAAGSGLSNMNPQMASLLSNHAQAMSKFKSSLLESLLTRKMPGGKFNEPPMTSQMAAAIIASATAAYPSLNENELEDGEPGSNLTDMESSKTGFASSKDSATANKMHNLTKLLQNIAEMSQQHHTSASTTPASSSPSSSSTLSSSSNLHQNLAEGHQFDVKDPNKYLLSIQQQFKALGNQGYLNPKSEATDDGSAESAIPFGKNKAQQEVKKARDDDMDSNADADELLANDDEEMAVKPQAASEDKKMNRRRLRRQQQQRSSTRNIEDETGDNENGDEMENLDDNVDVDEGFYGNNNENENEFCDQNQRVSNDAELDHNDEEGCEGNVEYDDDENVNNSYSNDCKNRRAGGRDNRKEMDDLDDEYDEDEMGSRSSSSRSLHSRDSSSISSMQQPQPQLGLNGSIASLMQGHNPYSNPFNGHFSRAFNSHHHSLLMQQQQQHLNQFMTGGPAGHHDLHSHFNNLVRQVNSNAGLGNLGLGGHLNPLGQPMINNSMPGAANGSARRKPKHKIKGNIHVPKPGVNPSNKNKKGMGSHNSSMFDDEGQQHMDTMGASSSSPSQQIMLSFAAAAAAAANGAPGLMGQSPPQQLPASSSPSSATSSNNAGKDQIRFSTELWRCPYCCYETTSASRYNSHLVCHGWKPYLCPHCGSRSNRLPDMRTHISTFHPECNVNSFVVLNEEDAKSTLKDYMKNRALINRKLKEMRPQPKFKCKLCPYASLYQFNLTKHVKSVHLNDIYNNAAAVAAATGKSTNGHDDGDD